MIKHKKQAPLRTCFSGSLSNPVDGVENTLSIRQRIFVF